MGDVWPIVHAERAALTHDLEGLDDKQWEQPSLCVEWTIHDVVAHLADTALTTRVGRGWPCPGTFRLRPPEHARRALAEAI